MDAVKLISALAARHVNVTLDWERVLFEQYEALPRFRTAVDIGAHQALHTAKLAVMSDQVIAFEPIPILAEALGVRFAGTNVVVHACALSIEDRRASFAWNRNVPSACSTTVPSQ